MNRVIVFDLDMTLVDSSAALHVRKQRCWSEVYVMIPQMSVLPEVHEMLAKVSNAGYLAAVVTSQL